MDKEKLASYLLVFLWLLVSCKYERPKALVTIPTLTSMIEKSTDVYPTTNATSTRIKSTTTMTATTKLNEANTGLISLTITPQVLPEEIPQELAFFSGGGGGDLTWACSSLPDQNLDQIIIGTQEDSLNWFPLPMFEIVICNPTSTAVTISLIFPTGEEFILSPKIVGTRNIYAHFELPLGHPYGTYTIMVKDYPELGNVNAFDVQFERGPATVAKDFFSPQVFLYYFEPNELIHLLTYEKPSIESDGIITMQNNLAQLRSAEVYQVNSSGYLTINIDINLWNNSNILYTAIGEKTKHVRGALFHRITVINNGTQPICQLLMTSANTMDWQDYFINEWGFHINQLEPNEIYFREINPGIFDIEAKNCNGEIIYRKNNVRINGVPTLNIP